MHILNIIQIIVAVLLVVAILLQQRGGGLSSTFGGSGAFYGTRRGMERSILWATVVLTALFFATAVLNTLLRR
ncbi:MAG: preprotein translocase subunit SecG [Candidatus Sungbacteria bacterium]|nr:preprotein translocase subunit SecG [Candidatus Sungbacteria bacterium]